MSRYIGQYVSTCDLCLQTKPWRHSPVGELQPLSVPDARWDTLSVDFVVELPESSGHDAVMTIVDSVSKRVHFVPTHTMVTAEGAARLFLHHVWKLHGLPKRVVSDRGPQFVASFTKELYRLLGIRLSSFTVSQKVTYLFCDELDIVSKELRSRVRQATKDVVKSEV